MRRISATGSSRRKKVRFSGEGRSELDSHADTCVAGSNMVLISTTGEKVTVNARADWDCRYRLDTP